MMVCEKCGREDNCLYLTREHAKVCCRCIASRHSRRCRADAGGGLRSGSEIRVHSFYPPMIRNT